MEALKALNGNMGDIATIIKTKASSIFKNEKITDKFAAFANLVRNAEKLINLHKQRTNPEQQQNYQKFHEILGKIKKQIDKFLPKVESAVKQRNDESRIEFETKLNEMMTEFGEALKSYQYIKGIFEKHKLAESLDEENLEVALNNGTNILVEIKNLVVAVIRDQLDEKEREQIFSSSKTLYSYGVGNIKWALNEFVRNVGKSCPGFGSVANLVQDLNRYQKKHETEEMKRRRDGAKAIMSHTTDAREKVDKLRTKLTGEELRYKNAEDLENLIKSASDLGDSLGKLENLVTDDKNVGGPKAKPAQHPGTHHFAIHEQLAVPARDSGLARAFVAVGNDGIFYTFGFFNDVFKNAPMVTHIIFTTWFFSISLFTFSPSMQFLYRYLVLCRDWKPSYCLYTGLYSSLVLFLISFFILTNREVYVSRTSNALYREYILTDNPANVDLVVVNLTSSNTWTTLITGIAIVASISIVVVCGFKIWLHLRRHFLLVSDSNKNNQRLQRQVNYVLFTQGAMTIGKLITNFLNNFLNLKPEYMSFLTQCLVLLIMIVNPLLTLLLVDTYRRAILNLFLRKSAIIHIKGNVLITIVEKV
ncbi:serpentine type 7TM GPCR chemoreceptor str domain-containing protein [Ditylenchus destructor]|uniref:Serpentine type 7TM GPCR chemoreceptor str domain-containing protein n=1 Tax=Ditylenchus destructor TaxID=166010 RepID=A0AAD4QYI1_9BILA|nr:serpentine type 7TM GPCR chemoreceptor str domain-containing protein [Ditylenchus destructor]